MAISEDTAALVAAQLANAWATRASKGKVDPNNPLDAELLTVYNTFKGAIEAAKSASLKGR